jgi:glycosyltransferase involved in cell wall biosynthesis
MRWVLLSHDGGNAGTARAGRALHDALVARGHLVVTSAATSPAALLEPLKLCDAVLTLSDEGERLALQARRKAGRGAIVRRVGAAQPLTLSRGRGSAAVAYLFAARADAERAVLPSGAVRGGLLVPTAARAQVVAAPAVPPHVAIVAGAGELRRAHDAIRAVAAVMRVHPALRLVVLGAGDGADALRVHAGALGVAARVAIEPAFDHAGWLRTALAAWVVADGDDGCFAVRDAAAFGVPVILARTHVMARLYPADAGLVTIAPDETAVAAAAIAQWLGDVTARREAGERLWQASDAPTDDPVDVLERAVASLRPSRASVA